MTVPAAQEKLIEILHSFKKKRLSLHEFTVAFRRAFPEHCQAPDFRSRVSAALQGLERSDCIQLPQTGWDRSGRPPLPSTLILKATETPPKSERVDAWIPELAFATKVTNPVTLENLRAINAFLIRHRGKSLPSFPAAERSLEIFGDEKRLSNLLKGDGKLFNGNITLEMLGAYQVKPPLVHVAGKQGRPVLVIENLATFDSFKRWNQRSEAYSAIVLGSGKSFYQGHAWIDDLGKELGSSEFFYFGDLDPAGIEIPWKVNMARREEGLPPFLPHLQLYGWVLENGIRRSDAVKVLQKHRRMLEDYLGAERAGKILDLWNSGRLLPQESFGTEQLAQNASIAKP